ncbi:MAG TPA: hypothetical protein HA362_05390 [Nanoarchaeota archaeon]|nr:hypothetical protein [Nanoarchaeota archaeon]
MQIVKSLTREDLESIAGTGEIAYAECEASFLSRHAPNGFAEKPWTEISRDESLGREAGQRLFDISVKLDICVYRGTKLGQLAREKADDANPILQALGIEEVHESNAIAMLYSIKKKCLGGLAMLTHDAPEGYARIGETGGFDAEREELHAMFGKVPIVVYGSALTKANPADVDTMVILPAFNEEVYRKICGRCDTNRKPLLSMVIVPAEYFYVFAMNDTEMEERWSRVASGCIEVPMAGKERHTRLVQSNAASMYTRMRKALLPERLDALAIIHRLNYILKQPKFIARKLSELCGAQIPEPSINRFESLPSRQEMVDALVQANFSAYDAMSAYQRIENQQ